MKYEIQWQIKYIKIYTNKMFYFTNKICKYNNKLNKYKEDTLQKVGLNWACAFLKYNYILTVENVSLASKNSMIKE